MKNALCGEGGELFDKISGLPTYELQLSKIRI